MNFSGPVLLIAGPLLAALLALLICRRQRLVAVVGAVEAWILWGMVTAIPLEPTAVERANRLFAGDTLAILGRPLVLTDGIRALYLFLLVGSSLLFLLSFPFPQGRHFVPGGMAALAPLAAALMIEPFAFGALLLLVAMATLAVVIQSERATTTRAALRYLLMAVLAVPLLLTAGWMLAGEQLTLLRPASRLLLLGSLLLLAGFPFHIWVGPIVAETPLLVPAFIFGLVHLVVTAFIFKLLLANPALQQDAALRDLLRQSSVATAILAGLLALTATDFRRLLGSLLLLDMAMSLLALSFGSWEGWRTAVSLQIFRSVSLLLASTGLALLNRQMGAGADEVDDLLPERGLGRNAPLAALLFMYGCFSLLGLPLTVGFSGRWDIILSAQEMGAAGWQIYGLWLAMIVATMGLLRSLARLLAPAEGGGHQRPIAGPWQQALPALLLLLGSWLAIWPQIVTAYAHDLATLFR
jgi:NADH:ubiquinone oxidoreductase subunit 2 (subunit N)